MRILITGATGLIGTRLRAALEARGDQVVALTRNPDRVPDRGRTEWHQWDPGAGAPPAAALAGVEAIVNLAGERINQRWTPEAKKRIMSSRRDLTQALATALARVSWACRVFWSRRARLAE